MISGGRFIDECGINNCVALYAGGPTTPEVALRELKQKTREELNQDGFYRTITKGENGEELWIISSLSSKKPLLRFAEYASQTNKANSTQFVRIDYCSDSEKNWYLFSPNACFRNNDQDERAKAWLPYRLLFGGFFIFD